MTIHRLSIEDVLIRQATPRDQTSLAAFLNFQSHVHRHLDWKAPLDWLGSEPFWVAEYHNQPVAVFACPTDPNHVAWIRLFAVSNHLPIRPTWEEMLRKSVEFFSSQPEVAIVGLSLQPWFRDLMVGSGFTTRQSIVVLEWDGGLLPEALPSLDFVIRKMNPIDLPAVEQIDAISFEPLWQNSLNALELAYEQATYSTVAELNGEIIGYQISTGFPFGGHLARLAVHPLKQRKHIGYALVRDLLIDFKRHGAWRVTVNTQNDNVSSLTLYHRLGFKRTGEEFPVYQLDGST